MTILKPITGCGMQPIVDGGTPFHEHELREETNGIPSRCIVFLDCRAHSQKFEGTRALHDLNVSPIGDPLGCILRYDFDEQSVHLILAHLFDEP